MYESAAIKDPSSLHVSFGLGQLYIYKGEFEKATTQFEKILIREPDHYDTIKVYPLLHQKIFTFMK